MKHKVCAHPITIIGFLLALVSHILCGMQQREELQVHTLPYNPQCSFCIKRIIPPHAYSLLCHPCHIAHFECIESAVAHNKLLFCRLCNKFCPYERKSTFLETSLHGLINRGTMYYYTLCRCSWRISKTKKATSLHNTIEVHILIPPQQ